MGSELEAARERRVGQAAADAVRAAFVHGDIEVLSDFFALAGLHDLHIDTQTRTARFPSVRVVVFGAPAHLAVATA
ncbi:MAG: hypothetical protein AAGF73_01630 [Actinomycetota bacterium]